MVNKLVKLSSRPRKAGRAKSSIDSAQLYRVIADTLPHMLWISGADGAVEFLNARVLQYTGFSANQLKDWGWKPVLHPDDLRSCVERWKRALSSGRQFEAEYRLRRADGEYRWHFHTVLPLRNAEGHIVKWYGTCMDIDDRKKTAQRLEQARRALEAMVMARSDAAGPDRSGGVDRLSERERQVLQLIVDGRTSAEVGERLGLSPKSVDTYRSRLMAKLGIEHLPALVKFAIRHGITTIG